MFRVQRRPDAVGKQLVLSILEGIFAEQNRQVKWTTEPFYVRISLEPGRVDIISSTNLVTTKWAVLSDNPMEVDGTTLTVRLESVKSPVLVAVERDDASPEVWRKHTYGELLDSHQVA